MSEKAQTWVPADLMDEMIPPPRNSPDDWIGSLDDGAPAIIAGVGHGGTAKKICLLRDGEVVKFCSMTPHGSAILTLWAKRQWSVDNPMPQFAEPSMSPWFLGPLGFVLRNARPPFSLCHARDSSGSST